MLRVDVQSGVPFTPMVQGDVNGDGQQNDRAFVFGDASGEADPQLAADMRALLASADGYARDCLRAQLGRVAGRNSCRSGWTVRPDLRVNFNPRDNFGFGNRLRATLNLTNASGAMFRLLGLSDTPLGRASMRTAPDPTLLYVDGFDPATQRYRYRVNQRFGDTRAAGRRTRPPTAPFTVQLGLEWAFGGPSRTRMAQNLGLVPGRGEAALTLDEARQRLRRMQRSPAAMLLDLRDSLALDSAQVRRIEAIDAAYLAEADSVLAPVAAWVVERGRRVTDVELFRRLSESGQANAAHDAGADGRGGGGAPTGAGRAAAGAPRVRAEGGGGGAAEARGVEEVAGAAAVRVSRAAHAKSRPPTGAGAFAADERGRRLRRRTRTRATGTGAHPSTHPV